MKKKLQKEMPELWELSHIDIEVDYKKLHICVMDYVDVKTKNLMEFGYKNLTEDQVLASTWRVFSDQIEKANVIDQFIKQDFPHKTTR